MNKPGNVVLHPAVLLANQEDLQRMLQGSPEQNSKEERLRRRIRNLELQLANALHKRQKLEKFCHEQVLRARDLEKRLNDALIDLEYQAAHTPTDLGLQHDPYDDLGEDFDL